MTVPAGAPAQRDHTADLPAQPLGPWGSHRPRAVIVLRWLLLPAIAACTLSWLLLTPRSATVEQLAERLSAGEVQRYEVGRAEDLLPFGGMRFWTSGDETTVVWCGEWFDCHRTSVAELRFHLTGTDELPAVDVEEADVEPNSAVVSAMIERYAADADAPRVAGSPLQGLGLLSAATWLVVLWILITGPQPRRATKWSTFWLLGLPGGLGLLWVLSREAPWSRTGALRPEPLPGPAPHRWTGGWTFLAVALLTPFAAGIPDLLQSPFR